MLQSLSQHWGKLPSELLADPPGFVLNIECVAAGAEWEKQERDMQANGLRLDDIVKLL